VSRPDTSKWLKRIPGVFDTNNWPVPFAFEEMPPLFFEHDDVLVVFEALGRSQWLERSGGRYDVPNRVDALVDKPDLPRCQLRVEIVEGRPACTHLTLLRRPGEAALTSLAIRVPLKELVIEISRLVVGGLTGTEPQELRPKAPRAEPGKRLPQERLEEVARVYRYALSHDRPPTNAVAEALDVSRSTAGRYVVRARRAGLLGPASPGVAGELDPEGGPPDG
jgi:hypothetical protein